MEKARVVCDPQQVAYEDLVAAVDSAGYGVVEGGKGAEEGEAEALRPMRKAKGRMVSAWVRRVRGGAARGLCRWVAVPQQ